MTTKFTTTSALGDDSGAIMTPTFHNSINSAEPGPAGQEQPVWLCLRSQPKHEHIAAAHLRRMVEGIEVFCPRLRIRRKTRRGVTWFVEALFPGYLFARFVPIRSMAHVRSVPGVKTIVHFGKRIPVISSQVIAGLREHFDQQEVREVTEELEPGQEITIAGGPFDGLTAAVLDVRSGSGRVQILLEMLGRCMPVEVSREQVVSEKKVAKFLAA